MYIEGKSQARDLVLGFQDQDWDDSKKTMQWIDIRREKTTGGAPSADLLEADRKDPSVVSRRKIG